jgi:hypothetical protein
MLSESIRLQLADGGAEGDAFRLAVACYPKGDPDDRA